MQVSLNLEGEAIWIDKWKVYGERKTRGEVRGRAEGMDAGIWGREEEGVKVMNESFKGREERGKELKELKGRKRKGEEERREVRRRRKLNSRKKKVDGFEERKI